MLIDRLTYLSMIVSPTMGFILVNAYFDPQSAEHMIFWANGWFWVRMGLLFFASLGVGAFIATFAYESDRLGYTRPRKDPLATFIFALMPGRVRSFFRINTLGGFVLTAWLTGNVYVLSIFSMLIYTWVTGIFLLW